MGFFHAHVHQALARWEGFPVHQEPRPIVLNGLSSKVLERLGSDNQRRARFDGPADPDQVLPPEILSGVLDYCRDMQTGLPGPPKRVLYEPGPFGTDRGVREFPAWIIHPRNRRCPLIQMDLEFKRQLPMWWPEGLQPSQGRESVLADDGRTLTYRFIGTPSAYAAYPRAEVFETETAVLVEPTEIDRNPRNTVRLDYMEGREVVVRLSAPLGNRILIWHACRPDSPNFGAPLTVIASGQPN